LVVGPRIEEPDTGRGEVLGVPGRTVQAVTSSGGSKETVAGRNDFAGFGAAAVSSPQVWLVSR